MILATAGHVDHGKTTLIRALTGIDTDRLVEEKQRGMSIDLGFAHADLGAGRRTAFVDVPGHEKFARNMLAGLAAIDGVLLVIAADDGPMPQTREHLAVLDLLGIARGAIVLSKCDAVDAARLITVHGEIDELLRGTTLAGLPRFAVAAPQDTGIAALRAHLAQLASDSAPAVVRGSFRCAIDRAFQIGGAGLVVTGTVTAGRVALGDTLVLSPLGRTVRVRGLQVHDAAATGAQAGQRCALNLVGDVRPDDIARGDQLLAPVLHAPTRRIDVRLRFVDAPPRSDSPTQVHIGAAAVPARLHLLDDDGLTQLVLEREVAALHGDRLILRDPAARKVSGGGTVIDPCAPQRGRARPLRLAQLRALEADAPAALGALLALDDSGVDLARFALARNLTAEDGAALEAAVPMRKVRLGATPWAYAPALWQRWRDALLAALAQWHRQQPDSVGPGEAALGAALATRLAPPLLRALIQSLLDEQRLVRDGVCLRLPAHRAELNAQDAAVLARIAPLLAAGGLRPPIVGELAAALAMERAALLDILQRCARLGHLVAVAPNRFYPPAAVAALEQLALALADAEPAGFDAATFRDRSGIGRNLSIEVLEFLDRNGCTRRVGDRRQRGPAWRAAAIDSGQGLT